MRLIDVDALNLEYEVDMADDWKTAHEIANIVKYAPTIDAVPREKYERMKESAEILSKAYAEMEYVVRCKDCAYQIERWNGVKCCEAHGDHIGADYDFCSNGRRVGDPDD